MGELTLIVRGTPVRCVVERTGDQFAVRLGAVTQRLRLLPLEPGVCRLFSDGRWYTMTFARENARCFLHVDGHTVEYLREEAEAAGSMARQARHGDLSAPMPGTVTQVLVRDGDEVAPGQPLVIVEAMKMEHVIRSPGVARVRAVRVRPGDQVDGGAIVAQLDGGFDEPPG